MARPPTAAQAFNQVALLVAGRRLVPVWASLRHRGRRSGKEYVVPIAVIPTDTTFVIALAWGRGADWVRNVRAAGGCTIRWRGVDYTCTEPAFVDQEVAVAAARGVVRLGLRRVEVPGGFIQLARRPSG